MRLTHDDQLRRHRIRLGIERTRELTRLRDREASLVTLTTQAPVQLARVRDRIAELERHSR